MIARVWHGTTSRENRPAYLKYLKTTGMPAFKKSRGNLGVYLLVRDSQELTEYLIVSLWDSIKAVRGFAGSESEKAVYFPKDSEFLLGLEPDVKHFEVVAKI
jgi:heme-degrading monooxygenase HmoA